MNPAKLGISLVPESSKPSSLGFVALATNPANPQLKPGLLFVLMNPAKLGKLGSSS